MVKMQSFVYIIDQSVQKKDVKPLQVFARINSLGYIFEIIFK